MRVINEQATFPLVKRAVQKGVDEGESVPFAVVHRGFAVVIESINDLNVVEAVVGGFVKFGENGYQEISSILRNIDDNFDRFLLSPDELSRQSESILSSIPDDPKKATSIETLFVAIRSCRELWETADEAGNIHVALAMHPSPSQNVAPSHEDHPFDAGDVLVTFGHRPEPPYIIDGYPTLMVKPGSLLAELGWHTVATGFKWVVTVYAVARAYFQTAHEAADYFVTKLRTKAEQTANQPALPRLDSLTTAEKRELRRASHVVVLLHGLFSTDVGTFDGLREAWDDYVTDKLGEDARDVAWVAWPHNTLATINDNAHDLYVALSKAIGDTDSHLLFVCHSRGGLLARATAQELFDRQSWKDRLKGCVTFGSPHKGAKLASNPLRNAGGYALVYRATGSLKAFDSLLIYLHHKKRIDGIDDLAPVGNPVSRFLEQLEASEKHFKNRPEITAIGGDVSGLSPKGSMLKKKLMSLMYWGTKATVGGRHHDKVVPTSSAAPTWADYKTTVKVDHFSYFDKEDEESAAGIKSGLYAIQRAFDLEYEDKFLM